MTARSPRTRPTISDQIQLPIWPQTTRGVPHAIARSALFCVAQSRANGPREHLSKKGITTVSGMEITYSGFELRQDDEDVYLQLLHLARIHELGAEVRFAGFSILSELSWDKSSKGYTRLVECIERLQHTSLAIHWEDSEGSRKGYVGSLVSAFAYGEKANVGPGSREWQITLDPKIMALFGQHTYSRVDWNTRLKLGPMAKWLHSFYHTHEEPFPYKVDTVRGLMGSKIKELRGFRYKLKQALAELTEVGFFRSAHIDARTDLVIVCRAARQEQLQ